MRLCALFNFHQFLSAVPESLKIFELYRDSKLNGAYFSGDEHQPKGKRHDEGYKKFPDAGVIFGFLFGYFKSCNVASIGADPINLLLNQLVTGASLRAGRVR